MNNELEAPAPLSAMLTPMDSVAHSLALGLRSREARHIVLQAMRTSPWSEHKLELKAFVAGEAGQRVLTLAASAVSADVDLLRRQIEQLPEMDFYMPGRAHRMTWTGRTAPAIAVSSADRESELLYFDGASPRRIAAERVGSAESTPMLLLHAAEPKGIRMTRQADVSGRVIQDAADGELSVWQVERGPAGDSVVSYFLSMESLARAQGVSLEVALTASGGRPLAGPALLPRVRGNIYPASGLTQMYVLEALVLGVCDNNLCGTNNEFEFRSHFFDDAVANGGVRLGRVDTFWSAPSDYWSTSLMLPLGLRQPLGSERIYIDMVETDQAPNPDDKFGPSIEIHQYTTNLGDPHSVGDARCGYSSPYVSTVDCTEWTWRELNFGFLPVLVP